MRGRACDTRIALVVGGKCPTTAVMNSDVTPGATVWYELPLRRLRSSPPIRFAMPEAAMCLPFDYAIGGQRDAFYVPARSIDR
jgi:hypothetical protein